MTTFYYILFAIALGVYLLWRYVKRNFNFFKEQGIPYRWPMSNLQFFYKDILIFLRDAYYIYPDAKVIGSFDLFSPSYLIRDPEIIKEITVKYFDHFHDKKVIDLPNAIVTRSLTSLNGQEWKDMRTTLSPAFTGSKLTQMLELINDCSNELNDYFLNTDKNDQIVDMEDAFTRLTNDTIASCAFGIKINSFKDKDNEFYVMGNKLVNPANQRFFMIKVLFVLAAPKLGRMFNIEIFDSKLDPFFRSLIIDAMNVREREKIFRPDMINLLMQIRKGDLNEENLQKESDIFSVAGPNEKVVGGKSKSDWTDDDLVAQCILFFIGGFGATSFILRMLSYELALHPDVQDRLIEEIDNVIAKNDGKITFESLQSMKYLAMVVSENLRLWPAGVVLERTCVKPFKYEDPDGFTVQFEKGMNIATPIPILHRDPKYFPDPDKFDPERFNEENIGNIVPYTYIPFGAGPRSCIGARFVLMQTKIVIFNILKTFKFEVCEKTQVPLKVKGLFMKPENGLYLRLKKRS